MTVARTEITSGRNLGIRQLECSPLWGSVALSSLVFLGVVAPSGLMLMGFLGVIVLAHEAGHLLAARKAGMQPTEYFWGFGPEIVAIEINGCRYGLKAIFLGGYVKLQGMTPTAELPEGFAEEGTYRAARHRGRLLTILAGPGVNLVMAVLAFTAAALLEGESVLAAVAEGFEYVWLIVVSTGEALWLFASNLGGYFASVFGYTSTAEAPARFMSPVAQAQTSGMAVESGMIMSLRWFAILSCAIGVVNLLPLPPLDGSHALVAGVEGIIQRVRNDRSIALNVARLVPLAYLTLGILLLLSLTALVMDVRDLV